MTSVASSRPGIASVTSHDSFAGDTSTSVTSITTLSDTRVVTERIRLIGAAFGSAADGIKEGWTAVPAQRPFGPASVGGSLQLASSVMLSNTGPARTGTHMA